MGAHHTSLLGMNFNTHIGSMQIEKDINRIDGYGF